MGGVAGHMSHLYDNRNLTFQKMKEILEAASEGDLDAEEKVDGQNLFLSYSVPEGKAMAARNKGNLLEGGMDATALAEKFAGRGALSEAFKEGFQTFETAVNSLSEEGKIKIFGPNTDIWYNAEVMDPRSPNVINYDSQVLKIHDGGHFRFNKETGKKTTEDVEKNLAALDARIDHLQAAVTDSNFNFVRQAITTLEKLDNEVPLQRAVAQINAAIHAENLNDDNTVGEYLYQRLFMGIDTDLSEELRVEITKYILKLPGRLNLRLIKKGLNRENLEDLVTIVNNKNSILQQAIYPIEKAVHDFSVEVLKGIESRFIIDSGAEVGRLQKELATAVKAITDRGPEDPEGMEIMQRHLNKIGEMINISTPIEGIVFDYDGHTYKFTGNFAPLNQILGMFKYGRSPKLQAEHQKKVLVQEKDSGSPNLRREKAKQFVLSLPKFSPSEAWGDPESMERKQIQRIFDTVGGGATIQEKLQFLNDSINNPTGGITSPTRIISTLILMESLAAVIRSFNAASAGFVFEGFLAALFRGRQEVAISAKGNLPIQDLIAFSELGDEYAVPVSLKLLNQTTNIEGSYTNLVDALDEFGNMLYIVARKDANNIVLEKFTFTRDNFIDALSLTARGGRSKEKNLFLIPDLKTVEQSLKLLNSLDGEQSWPQKYELLQQTAGYRNRTKKAKVPDETVTVSDELPDGEDIGGEEEISQESKTYSIDQNRKLLNEGAQLLLESETQWAISPKQLEKVSSMVDYEKLGTLPTSEEGILKTAEQYIDDLSENLQTIFQATANLSENINEYFTYDDRSQAITAGTEAIEDSKIISSEMQSQLSQDSQGLAANVKEGLMEGDRQGRRIVLFPGKFKPPHRGHLEYVKAIAQRSDVDEVLIMISPVDYPEVSTEQSIKIWKKYLENGPDNIGVQIADYRSPVTAVYEFIADPTATEPGDTVVLLKSSKDESKGDSRFKGAQAWAKRENPGISVEEIQESPIEDASGVAYSAEDIRQLIASDKQEKFDHYTPEEVDSDIIWNILKPLSAVDQEIDDVIDEMSSVGSVGAFGYSLPIGDKPTYPGARKRKSNKPKVNRGKRQRRR